MVLVIFYLVHCGTNVLIKNKKYGVRESIVKILKRFKTFVFEIMLN